MAILSRFAPFYNSRRFSRNLPYPRPCVRLWIVDSLAVSRNSHPAPRIDLARTIAIGDIHGCAEALRTVIEAIDVNEDDTLVTLGDYIDRGPDSRGVIDLLLDVRQRCRLIHLLGNHEVMMLAARDAPDDTSFWDQCGGKQTLESYGGNIANVPETHWEFLNGCKRWHEDEDYFFVHANYDPSISMDDQQDSVLLWTHLSYGIPLPHPNRKTAFVGHTPQPNCQIRDWGYLVCLDTFCFGDGCLTACDVKSRQLWQADKAGNLLQPH